MFQACLWNYLGSYYEQPDFDYQHILRFMDILAEDYDGYLSWLYKNSSSIVRRDTSVRYYDCSNFYFECEQPDEDIVDEVTREIINSLRKYGLSKEHRPNPIVEMGLFMDSGGSQSPCACTRGIRANSSQPSLLKKRYLRCLIRPNSFTVQMPTSVPTASGNSTAWAAGHSL